MLRAVWQARVCRTGGSTGQGCIRRGLPQSAHAQTHYRPYPRSVLEKAAAIDGSAGNLILGGIRIGETLSPPNFHTEHIR